MSLSERTEKRKKEFCALSRVNEKRTRIFRHLT